ncbi:MAG: ATP-binding cassette domain-containing protein [Acidobacteria bacterium]|nr:ATP-binding cassette domain-containing protein [Acidobacteriota bacterium]
MESVVDVRSVTKKFRLHQGRHKNLKDRILHPGQGTTTDLLVLNDVSFHVGAGETVGVLGRNGSGKSTLLKCICGVLQPTAGEIAIRGALAGLLELGAGFQPELSGRDNIYLSGSMLGLSRKSVDAVFDDIVEFSELEKFIDSPVKFYSSGMYVRLGFAVAVNSDPDILVVDEVLAVGDERFQAKCMDRIRQFQADGRTILLVSHNADQVRALCDRAIVLEKGHMVSDAPAGESVRVFREHLLGQTAGSSQSTDAHSAMTIVGVTSPSGHFSIVTGQSLTLDVTLESDRPLDGRAMVEIVSRRGELIARTDPTTTPLSISSGLNNVRFVLPTVPFLDGTYFVNLGVVSPEGNSRWAWREQAAQLEVTYDGRGAGLVALSLEVRPS